MIQCFAPAIEKTSFETISKIKLISASKMDSGFKSIHPRVLHKHESLLEILYVRSGTGVYIVDNERYDVSQGDIIVNNANTLHDEEQNSSNNLNMYCIIVANVQMKDLPPNCLLPSGVSPVFPAEEYAEAVEDMMSMIYVMLATEPEACVETCHCLTMALLSQLLMLIQRETFRAGENQARTNHDVITAKVKNYIDSHYDEHFTLEDISREICVSPYYLSHVFKKSTGFSPMHYATRRRLGEAQSLLIMTSKPITEIALNIGFGSQCQFYNIFKKYIGMSPGKYRETYSNHQSKSVGKPIT